MAGPSKTDSETWKLESNTPGCCCWAASTGSWNQSAGCWGTTAIGSIVMNGWAFAVLPFWFPKLITPARTRNSSRVVSPSVERCWIGPLSAPLRCWWWRISSQTSSTVFLSRTPFKLKFPRNKEAGDEEEEEEEAAGFCMKYWPFSADITCFSNSSKYVLLKGLPTFPNWVWSSLKIRW